MSGEVIGRPADGEHDAETVAVEADVPGPDADAPDDPQTVYGTIVRLRDHDRRPIVPAWLRNGRQRRTVAAWALDYAWYCVRFHAWQSPRYLGLVAFWGVWGGLRLVKRQVAWFWVWEQNALRQAAASRGDKDAAKEWRALHHDARSTRKFRGIVLGAEALAIFAAVLVLRALGDALVDVACAVTALGALSYLGRPADKPILVRVSTGPRFVKLTAEMVRAAMCTLGIAAIKEPGQITFPSEIHRDGPGWLARVDLPPGTEAVTVLERRGKLSSALRLPVDQVWPSAGPDHAGQVDLWVGYAPASKMGQPTWSLASPTARTSVFEPAEFGTDERQRQVKTVLFERNFLLGGVPGSGKSYAARTLATVALLDPICEVRIAEFKGTGDFMDMADLCTVYVCGVDDAAFEAGEGIIAWALAECEKRGKRVEAAKKRGDAPEGKVTPELAGKPGSGLHPIVIVLDEVHELFGASKDAAKDCERAIKRGRALNITFILATQIPDKDALPPIITRCVTVRWCLAVQDQVANDMILGTGAYKRGLTATVYRPGLDAGWGIATGLEDSGPVRSHYPAPDVMASIIARATALRGGRKVGTADEAVSRRDVLADVLHVMSERADHWAPLAERLAELDAFYADWTGEMLSVRLRALGIESNPQKVDGETQRGCRRTDVLAAIARREIG